MRYRTFGIRIRCLRFSFRKPSCWFSFWSGHMLPDTLHHCPENIGVTPTKFSSINLKPCKKIIQTPTWVGCTPSNRKLYPKIPPRSNFLPLVCRGAPHQGLWSLRYPHTPNTHPSKTGVHHINIGPHPGIIWTPVGAVMKGVYSNLAVYNYSWLEIKLLKWD